MSWDWLPFAVAIVGLAWLLIRERRRDPDDNPAFRDLWRRAHGATCPRCGEWDPEPNRYCTTCGRAWMA